MEQKCGKSWKLLSFEGKLQVFISYLSEMKIVCSITLLYSNTFYSLFPIPFFVVKIFKIKYDKIFVRHSASISKFEWFEQPCCSSRALNWVQMLWSISVHSCKYNNWWKLLGPGLIKIKDINIKFFCNLLFNIKLWYICCGLHIKIFKKPMSQFHSVTSLQNHVIWLTNSVKILDFHHSIFPRRDRSGKWRFVYVVFSG